MTINGMERDALGPAVDLDRHIEERGEAAVAKRLDAALTERLAASLLERQGSG